MELRAAIPLEAVRQAKRFCIPVMASGCPRSGPTLPTRDIVEAVAVERATQTGFPP